MIRSIVHAIESHIDNMLEHTFEHLVDKEHEKPTGRHIENVSVMYGSYVVCALINAAQQRVRVIIRTTNILACRIYEEPSVQQALREAALRGVSICFIVRHCHRDDRSVLDDFAWLCAMRSDEQLCSCMNLRVVQPIDKQLDPKEVICPTMLLADTLGFSIGGDGNGIMTSAFVCKADSIIPWLESVFAQVYLHSTSLV